MIDHRERPTEKKPTPEKKNDMVRRMYIKPQLKELGDLRTLTLGASTGTALESPVNGLEWWTP